MNAAAIVVFEVLSQYLAEMAFTLPRRLGPVFSEPLTLTLNDRIGLHEYQRYLSLGPDPRRPAPQNLGPLDWTNNCLLTLRGSADS